MNRQAIRFCVLPLRQEWTNLPEAVSPGTTEVIECRLPKGFLIQREIENENDTRT
jgi:hypothetical protein